MTEIKKKKWLIKRKPENNELIVDLAESVGVSEALSTLLVNRGFTDEESAVSFIKKSQEKLHDPFLLNDMDKAVSRILLAIENKEKITIYGDYDVDGVTSVCNLFLYLKGLGAVVDYYIPCRQSEGYGVSKDALLKLKDKGTNLVITVDTGVTAIEEISYANNIGIDIIVTDHHECTEILPDAIAVINPKRQDSTYPFSYLAGVGVVFKLLCAVESVKKKISILEATKNVAYSYADLTAIGTIADVMPVIDENRIITAYGLERAENTDKIGLAALIKQCRSGDGKTTKQKIKKKLNTGFVGFTLAPRINAAGRISSASLAVELFLSQNEKKADELALELCDINKERQFTENKIAEEAFEMINCGDQTGKSIIILDNDKWHHGVIGIVASKVTEKYGVPSILISFEGNEDPFDDEAIGKGSGRSISGMNLFEALSSCEDLLEKSGGHELAAGLTVKRKNLPKLIERLEEYASKCFNDGESQRILEIDTEISTAEINFKLAEELSLLEPYGVANPTPLFATRNMVIEDVVPVGMNRHLRLVLSKDNKTFSAMLFSVSPEEFALNVGDEVDVAYNLETNEFLGNVSLQINVRDICASQRSVQIEAQNEALYVEAREGLSKLSVDYIIPDREDCAAVYNHLSTQARCGQDYYTYTRLTSDLNQSTGGCKFNYVKVKFIIKIFRELNIIGIEEIDEKSFKFKLIYGKNKTSLEKSNILKKLKCTYKTN